MKSDGRPTVLIADGHMRYRLGLVRAIASHPKLRLGPVTGDGVAALSLIIAEQPDLALLDVRLGRLDRFAISERLPAAEPRPPTRVLLLSAVLDQAQRARAYAVGAAGCLSKDASRGEICDALIAAAQSSAGSNRQDEASVTLALAPARGSSRPTGSRPDDAA